jgi:hypothetical protein
MGSTNTWEVVVDSRVELDNSMQHPVLLLTTVHLDTCRPAPGSSQTNDT